jgi:hypothetical protein
MSRCGIEPPNGLKGGSCPTLTTPIVNIVPVEEIPIVGSKLGAPVKCVRTLMRENAEIASSLAGRPDARCAQRPSAESVSAVGSDEFAGPLTQAEASSVRTRTRA